MLTCSENGFELIGCGKDDFDEKAYECRIGKLSDRKTFCDFNSEFCACGIDFSSIIRLIIKKRRN